MYYMPSTWPSEYFFGALLFFSPLFGSYTAYTCLISCFVFVYCGGLVLSNADFFVICFCFLA